MRRHIPRPLAVAAFGALFLAAAWFTGCDLPLLWSRRGHLTDIAREMFPPEWSFAGKVLPLLWITVQMSVTGTVLGAVLSVPAAMVCAAPLPGPRAVKKLLRFCIQVLRSFPALILALLATFFLGIGAFAGTAAITVYTFAIMTRLTYEDMEHAPLGPYTALRAMGATSVRAFSRSIFPEIAPSYLTNALYLLEGNVRHSAILGYVGAGGIGLLLNEKVSWREYGKVGMILLLLFVTVYLMEALSTLLTRLVQQTAAKLGDKLLYVMADAPAGDTGDTSAYDLAALGRAADKLVLRVDAYEKTGEELAVAPLEPMEELYSVLARLDGVVAPEKLSVCISTRGVCWTGEKRSGTMDAQEIRAQAEDGAKGYYSSRYEAAYLTWEKGGKQAVVWYLDSRAMEVREQLLRLFGVGQVCFQNVTERTTQLPEL